ncbi:hypothetical protein TNCV_2478791 [Trichonephila clavipes]|nr:hypothetical protein TNCV_2478791 [Trichonephila clavipes]
MLEAFVCVVGVLCLLTPSSQAKSVSQRLVIRIPDDRVRKRRAVTLRCSFRMKWDDLTDDFENRNLECVSILLSSIWDSDFHGFGNLGLKRGA